MHLLEATPCLSKTIMAGNECYTPQTRLQDGLRLVTGHPVGKGQNEDLMGPQSPLKHLFSAVEVLNKISSEGVCGVNVLIEMDVRRAAVAFACCIMHQLRGLAQVDRDSAQWLRWPHTRWLVSHYTRGCMNNREWRRGCSLTKLSSVVLPRMVYYFKLAKICNKQAVQLSLVKGST